MTVGASPKMTWRGNGGTSDRYTSTLPSGLSVDPKRPAAGIVACGGASAHCSQLERFNCRRRALHASLVFSRVAQQTSAIGSGLGIEAHLQLILPQLRIVLVTRKCVKRLAYRQTTSPPSVGNSADLKFFGLRQAGRLPHVGD